MADVGAREAPPTAEQEATPVTGQEGTPAAEQEATPVTGQEGTPATEQEANPIVLEQEAPPVVGNEAPEQEDTSKVQTPQTEPENEFVQRSTTIKLDSHGDVILALTSSNGEARFQVSSRILCLGSPVFRAMLGVDSGFREAVDLSKRDASRTPFELALGDDDPNAMAVILRILHFKHYWIPKSLTPERLYEVAIICDKYDLRQAMETWLSRWTPESFAGKITLDQWLFIAYVLGKDMEFKNLSKDLILQCTSDSSGNLKVVSHSTDENGGKTEYVDVNTYIPDPVLAEIKSTRQKTILAMIDAVNSEIEQYSHPDHAVHCSHNVVTCDTVILGVLMTGFKRLNAYPDASGIINQAINDVRMQLGNVKFPDILVLQKSTSGGCCEKPAQHEKCLDPAHEHCDKCHKCASCDKHYKPVTEVDHASCSPLPRLMKRLDELVSGVVGLEYSQFVSKETQKNKPDVSDDDLCFSLWFDPLLGPYY